VDPRELFTSRAENYAKFRPSYPDDVREAIESWCGLRFDSVVADVGSGTGIFSDFIAPCATVYAIEPNSEMRAVAEATHVNDSWFRSIEGCAEALNIPDSSVDLVTAAQSFHWFDPEKSRAEFIRVLKPPGWVALVWNVRTVAKTPFQIAYEEFLRSHAPRYTGAQHDKDEAARIEGFFGSSVFQKYSFENPQFLFWEELLGRAMSASYFPLPGDPNHEPAITALQQLFETHKQGGRVDFDYSTELFLGKIKPG